MTVQFSRSVVSDSLRSHELQHARPPCPSPKLIWNNNRKEGVVIPEAQIGSETTQGRVNMQRKKGGIGSTQARGGADVPPNLVLQLRPPHSPLYTYHIQTSPPEINCIEKTVTPTFHTIKLKPQLLQPHLLILRTCENHSSILMVPEEAVGTWRLLKRGFKFTLEAWRIGITFRKAGKACSEDGLG